MRGIVRFLSGQRKIPDNILPPFLGGNGCREAYSQPAQGLKVEQPHPLTPTPPCKKNRAGGGGKEDLWGVGGRPSRRPTPQAPTL